MTIGEKVKQAREAKGMTQEELAHALGYKSRSSVNKIETGDRDVPRNQIKKIAQILGVPPISLLGFEDENDEQPLVVSPSVSPFKVHAQKVRTNPVQSKVFAVGAKPPKKDKVKPILAETAKDRLRNEAKYMTTTDLLECLSIIQKALEEQNRDS